MPKISAGLLVYRVRDGTLQVFLVHPGGPFWERKDLGAWTMPKGEVAEGEDLLVAAQREFEEETGSAIRGRFMPLASRKQPSGKTVHTWAVEGDLDAGAVRSNTFSMEWPRGSGRQQVFPEVDRAAWFDMDEARRHILPGLAGFLDDLERARSGTAYLK